MNMRTANADGRQQPTQSGNPHGATGHRKAAIQNPQLISVNDSKVAV